MSLFTSALTRGVIPLLLMLLIAVLLRKQKKDSKQVRGVICVALIWGIAGAASVLYEITWWSFSTRLIIHFLIMLLSVFPILLVSGWFKVTTLLDVVKVLLIFLVIGICFAFIGYLITR